MADHIPFVMGSEGISLLREVYGDSEVVRIPLHNADRLCPLPKPRMKLWLDPSVDGMDDLRSRRGTEKRKNQWFEFMKAFPCFEQIGAPDYRPVQGEVHAFVEEVLNRCARLRPVWITVPQLPLVAGSHRNRVNRALAEATAKWHSDHGFQGHLILPLIVTQLSHIKGRTERRPHIEQAKRCYDAARADGLWVVASSLDDEGETTATTLRKRLSSMIALHEELNDRIASRTRIGGPYWGFNLVLWSRGLVDYPAIGIGTGYQYHLAGGTAKQPDVRIALSSLRRRVGVNQLAAWLDRAVQGLAATSPVCAEFSETRNQLPALRDSSRARAQVAAFYKRWFDMIGAEPRSGRAMALFQDLSAAYAFGKSLPDLPEVGPARKPAAVAEPLMLSCL
jgi:hypothetical protein